MKRIVLIAAFLVALAAPAWADVWDGMRAYNNGDYETALQILEPLAEGGDITAQYYLAQMYQFGHGVPQSIAEAAKWYRNPAEDGDKIAQFYLGLFHYSGIDVPQNYSEARRLWLLGAAENFADVQFWLGDIYLAGKGVPQNHVEAAKWFRLAAKGDGFFQPDTPLKARTILGMMYMQGWGVPQDLGEGANWIRGAADLGNAVAQYYLGRMYVNGEGVPQDYVQAHMWSNLAAVKLPLVKDQNDPITRDDAVKIRDALVKRMTPDQIAEAQRLAREWEPKTE